MHLAQAQFVEIGQLLPLLHALGLVGRENGGLAETAQVVGNVMVLRRQALARIDHEDHDIGFGHRLLCLTCHFTEDAAGSGIRLETAGIDDDELAAALATIAIMAITRQAGKIGHDGIARLGHAVKQGGLAHVGPPHQGDHGFHVRRFLYSDSA